MSVTGVTRNGPVVRCLCSEFVLWGVNGVGGYDRLVVVVLCLTMSEVVLSRVSLSRLVMQREECVITCLFRELLRRFFVVC